MHKSQAKCCKFGLLIGTPLVSWLEFEVGEEMGHFSKCILWVSLGFFGAASSQLMVSWGRAQVSTEARWDQGRMAAAKMSQPGGQMGEHCWLGGSSLCLVSG